jgi:hypothetical protein
VVAPFEVAGRHGSLKSAPVRPHRPRPGRSGGALSTSVFLSSPGLLENSPIRITVARTTPMIAGIGPIAVRTSSTRPDCAGGLLTGG